MKWDPLLPQITDQQYQQLERFSHLLSEWNQRINLVSRQDINSLWENHILPSVIPFAVLQADTCCWVLDIGSGGGLPAIPLSILQPDWQMLMVDSMRKKSLFLKNAITDLDLKNSAVIHQRVEKLSQDFSYQRKFDIITARAVASISRLLNWGRPFLKPGGVFWLWKGDSDITELKEVAEQVKFQYQILTLPKELHKLSPKFNNWCLFLIKPDRK